MGLLYNYMNPSFIKILSLLSEIKNNNDPDELNRESDKPDPDKYNQLISRGVKLGLSDIMRKRLAKFIKPEPTEPTPREKSGENPITSKSRPTPTMPQRKQRRPGGKRI